MLISELPGSLRAAGLGQYGSYSTVSPPDPRGILILVCHDIAFACVCVCVERERERHLKMAPVYHTLSAATSACTVSQLTRIINFA